MKAVCQLCGYVYDDEKESVPVAELPDDWTCPCCGAPKEFFEIEGSPEEAAEPVADAHDEAVRMEQLVMSKLANATHLLTKQITATLANNTGPGLIGVEVFLNP